MAPPHVVLAPRASDIAGVLYAPDGLQVHLQPIVDLTTGEVWGVEALSRFPGHPAPGPDAWFATAVRCGMGAALEERALRQALSVLSLLPAGLRLTVNLSPEALLTPDVHELLLRTGDARVVVELTEHEHVSDYEALVRGLAELRAVGIGVSIDDLGAGHSSLRHVVHLEPDVIKLDLSLVQGVAACPRRMALVEAMLGFCARTGTLLVAEGVEEPDDLTRLVELGVSHAQGWFLARPADLLHVLPVLHGAFRPPVIVLRD